MASSQVLLFGDPLIEFGAPCSGETREEWRMARYLSMFHVEKELDDLR